MTIVFDDTLEGPILALFFGGDADSVENKAEYTATPVACGWAGAVFEVT